MSEVNFVIGNKEKLDDKFWAGFNTDVNLENNNKVFVQNIMHVKKTSEHLVESFNKHTRGFVQVQNGCDHRCTFCVIPIWKRSKQISFNAKCDKLYKFAYR